MSLPELIEIVPLDKPVRAEITVPGSKSITNRALILAALSEGETELRGALWSDDTQVMVEGLRALGFEARVESDPLEACNRTITIRGLGGAIPQGGTLDAPLDLFVGNAGTAARFLTALTCLGRGIYRIHGVTRMHERPQEALFDALRELGYCIDSVNDKLPATIHGSGPKPGATCCVSIAESSQFASALLLGARVGGWRINVVGENAEESPYVAMTSQLMDGFPKRGGEFQIEPDASSASYFWAAGCIAPGGSWNPPRRLSAGGQSVTGQRLPGKQRETDLEKDFAAHSRVEVVHWPESRWQIDGQFPKFIDLTRKGRLVSRNRHLGDSILTLIALAPLTSEVMRFVDLGRLRVQECERVVALRTELTKCGAKVLEEGDTLTIYPSQLHGAEIETYHDHRMAMCFATLGLRVPGIKIRKPACVKKTFPNFFQKLAAPPPHGLGAAVRNARTGERLGMDELFAE